MLAPTVMNAVRFAGTTSKHALSWSSELACKLQASLSFVRMLEMQFRQHACLHDSNCLYSVLLLREAQAICALQMQCACMCERTLCLRMSSFLSCTCCMWVGMCHMHLSTSKTSRQMHAHRVFRLHLFTPQDCTNARPGNTVHLSYPLSC